MPEKFSELLTEYLEERDRPESYYYSQFTAAYCGRQHMRELLEKMDELIYGIEQK